MKKFLTIVFLFSLVACNNTASVDREVDTLSTKADSLINKVKNSEILDSVQSKGERLLDSTKSKGGRLWDSTKSKGGKLLNEAEKKINNLK